MSQYTKINLAARPEPGPITHDLFDIVTEDVPTVGQGEVLIRQTHMSLDPAMIGWMSADEESYVPPVGLGEVMRSSGIGQVVESRHVDFAVGDRVRGMMGWTELYLSDGTGLSSVPDGVDEETVLSIFALPGITAMKGLYSFGDPKAGETLVVSGAAGSVGSLVGQLAKADGLHVVGVAGDEEKCRWLVDDLGFDSAINYKTDDVAATLADLTPKGVDIYFENTGGVIQHAVFDQMNAHGRIVVCGMISDYIAAEPSAGPNWIPMVKKRLTVRGFTVPDHYDEIPSLLEQLTPYVMSGKVKYRSHVLDGLESAIDGLNLFFTGGNRGKLIVKL